MRLLPVATRKEAAALRKLPLIAVDVGFAGTTKSVGLSLTPAGGKPTANPQYFAVAAEMVRDFVRANGECVLILEAPLSGAFDANGNPAPRGAFEREGKPRWWNLRAGAQMALAALFFCRRLDELLPKRAVLRLVEGFVVGDESGKHAEVAAKLARAFRGTALARWHEAEADGTIIPITEWFCPPRTTRACPIVLHPNPV